MSINNNIWIDRGIIISLVYYISNNIKDIKKKKLMIDNKNIRSIIKILFPDIIIKKYVNTNTNSININIKNHNNKGICIDYVKNYDKFINTDYIKLIPWCDINDPLILYKYNIKVKINKYKILDKIKNFSLKVLKYDENNPTKWNFLIEKKIFNKHNIIYNNIDCKYIILSNLPDYIDIIDKGYIELKNKIYLFRNIINNLLYQYNKALLIILDNNEDKVVIKSFILEYNKDIVLLYNHLFDLNNSNKIKLNNVIYIIVNRLLNIINKYINIISFAKKINTHNIIMDINITRQYINNILKAPSPGLPGTGGPGITPGITPGPGGPGITPGPGGPGITPGPGGPGITPGPGGPGITPGITPGPGGPGITPGPGGPGITPGPGGPGITPGPGGPGITPGPGGPGITPGITPGPGGPGITPGPGGPGITPGPGGPGITPGITTITTNCDNIVNSLLKLLNLISNKLKIINDINKKKISQ